MITTQVGVQRKLYDRRGTLLGLVVIPYDWDDYLRRQRGYRFVVTKPRSLRDYLETPSKPQEFRTADVVLSRHENGAVELYGISLEEFETLPGCSFSPSAAYLRSIIE